MIEVKDLRKSYESGVVNDNISLSIPQGSIYGLLGPNGAGKSTIISLLMGFYKHQRGQILLDGHDISKLKLQSLRRQFALVLQDVFLFSGTILDNVTLRNPSITRGEVIAAAQMMGIHDFIMQLSSGYSTNVGERGSNLSGGQRQRIAIARTLLGKPKLLVMDEATSALDYDTERRVCNNLLESMDNSTVLFITHRLSSIRRADRILMMHDGALVESGTHQELIDLKGRYFALYRQQEAS